MLGKVLITLLVIVIAVIFLRRQRAQQKAVTRAPRSASRKSDPWQGQNRQHEAPPSSADTRQPMAGTLKNVLWLTLAAIVVAGSVVTYLHWQDQQRLVTVLLYRDADQSPVIYRVSKRNIGDGSFITQDGTRVTVSANERMEIVGL